MLNLQLNNKKRSKPCGVKSDRERESLIVEHVPLVRYLVGRIAIRLPRHIDRGDLESAGLVGLIDAVDKFDPSRQIKLKTYAEFRIRGAILDELRSRDWLPRSVRDKCNALDAAYLEVERKFGRPARDEEVAEYMELGMEAFYAIVNEVNSGAIINMCDIGFNDDDESMAYNLLLDSSIPDFSSLLSAKDGRKRLAKGIDSLPEKERLVIALYYYEELTLKEVGEVLGVSESRVSQIHTKAICRLKGRVNGEKIHGQKNDKTGTVR